MSTEIVEKQIPIPAKKPWASRTLWLNLFAGAVVLIGTFWTTGGQSLLPTAWLPYVAEGIILLNVALRLVTAQPLSIGQPASITVTGPVNQVGGEQFTAATTISGPVIGGNVRSLAAQKP